MKTKINSKKPIKKKPARKPALKKPVKKSGKKIAKKTVKKQLMISVVKKAIPIKKKTVKVKRVIKDDAKTVGEITHYFPKVQAAVIKLKIPLAVGEIIRIKGHTTDFNQKVTSIQIDKDALSQAKVGDEIGLSVESRVRGGDIVTKI
jgi:hypothetical protein